MGHDGCVNRLAWSPDGALLASVSDDRRLMLWQHGPPGAGGGARRGAGPGDAAATAAAEPLVVPTPHEANIFGVAFLPERTTLVTGAMDAAVCLIELREDGGGDAAAARGGGAGPVDWRRVSAAAVTVFRCHRGRVKAVAADPGAPVFFSAAEDGACRQFDARAPAAAQAGWGAANIAAAPRRRLELKSVDVNPARPEQLALAASDEIVRVYDRRRLTLAPPSGGVVGAPLLELAPPHASLRAAGGAALEEPPPAHATHVSFAPRGDRLVANFHGDAAYAWRLGGAAEDASAAAAAMRAPAARARRAGAPPPLPDAPALLAAGAAALAALAPPRAAPRAARRADPAAAAAALAAARAAYDAGDASGAIDVATRALRAAPRSVDLLIVRASALMRRGWFPDNMAALADLEAAAALGPRGRGGLSAAGQVQRVRVLLAAGLPRAAARALELHRAALGAPPPPDPALGGGETGRRVRACAPAAIGAGLDALAADVARGVAGSAAARGRARARGAAARAARRRRSREFRGGGGGGGGGGSGSGSNSDADADGAGAALAALDGAYAEALSAAAAGAGAASASTSPSAAAPPALYAALPGGARAAGAYVGALNCATDIKEATFLGEDGALVAAGSDDGRAWLFDAATGACLRALGADAEVVNCVRAHPVLPVLATSGIESTVRLWAPSAAVPARAGAELEARRGANVSAARRRGEARAGAGAGLAGALGGLNPQVLAALAARPELLARLLGGAAGGGEDGEEAAEQEAAEAEEEEEGLQGVAPNCRMA